jgi:hypothetical protein
VVNRVVGLCFKDRLSGLQNRRSMFWDSPMGFHFAWEAAVDGLIYRRRWIDGTAVAPHTFARRLAGEVVGFPDQRLAGASLFRRPLSKKCASSLATSKALS